MRYRKMTIEQKRVLWDRDRARHVKARDAMRNALAYFTPAELDGLVVKLPAGKAYGADDLHKAKRKALPMAQLGAFM